MAHITRIKASDDRKPDKSSASGSSDPKKKVKNPPKAAPSQSPEPKKNQNPADPTQNSAATATSPVPSKPPKPLTKFDKLAAREIRKAGRQARRALDRAARAEKRKNRKPLPTPLRVLFKPFTALGAYIHRSWLELRQVRWPNRRTTWKMTLAVLIYTGLFIAFIMLLDAIFTALFNIILG